MKFKKKLVSIVNIEHTPAGSKKAAVLVYFQYRSYHSSPPDSIVE